MKGLWSAPELASIQDLAERFMFHQSHARPEKVNKTILAPGCFSPAPRRWPPDGADAKDGEKFIPKGFPLGFLAGFTRPLIGKPDGIVSDFVPKSGLAGNLANEPSVAPGS